MAEETLSLGRSGEDIATDFLKAKGYKIITRNYKTKVGEIDIIAREKDTTCFVEVKTRRSDKFGLPQEAVLPFKQRKLSKTALIFLKENKLLDKSARFDIISIIFSGKSPKISLIQNAFELDDCFTY